jgi:4'-phosphopantetheinyl transferase
MICGRYHRLTCLLSKNDVHVWCASLDVAKLHIESLQKTLSADELRRAECFYFRKDYEHFIVARGLLRFILSRYLDIEPSQLRFRYNPYGKPALANTAYEDALCFNLSHSHGLAIYAVTRGREIGIDLERIQPDLPYEEIAEQFFSLEENRVLRALPAKMKREAFFSCWTRKEAYLKAKGDGLSFPLDQFDVSLTPGEPAMLLNTRGAPQEASRWSLHELTPTYGYIAALAIEGYGWRIAYWKWSE